MKVFDEVRAKLENWKKYNDKCLVKAEKRNDFDAMNYFRALNFALDRANGFMDDVEEMQSNEKEKEKDNRKPQTNIDRIRTMSEEELADCFLNFSEEYIVYYWCVKLCPHRKRELPNKCEIDLEKNSCPCDTKDVVIHWLKSEVKE